MKLGALSLGWAITIVVACGGNGGGTQAATTQSARGPCEQICEYDLMCASEPTRTVEECTADCVGDLAGWVRQDVLETLADCTTSLACTDDEDVCLMRIEPTATHRRWESACREKLLVCDVGEGACSVEPGTGDAGLVAFIAPAIVEEMIDCLDAADCNAKLACISAIADKYGIDF